MSSKPVWCITTSSRPAQALTSNKNKILFFTYLSCLCSLILYWGAREEIVSSCPSMDNHWWMMASYLIRIENRCLIHESLHASHAAIHLRREGWASITDPPAVAGVPALRRPLLSHPQDCIWEGGSGGWISRTEPVFCQRLFNVPAFASFSYLYFIFPHDHP